MPVSRWNKTTKEWEAEPIVKGEPVPGAPMGLDPDNLGRDDKVNRMGTGSIPHLITEFAIPSIVGMLVNGAYNIIDSIFLGSTMHEIGQAAITAANPIMIIFMAVSMFIGSGGNALAALRLGEGDHDGAERSLGNTVSLSLIVGTFVAILAFMPPCIEALLTISGTTPEVWGYTKSFVQILSLGFVLQCIGMGVNNFIRTVGNPNRALGTMIIGAVGCVFGNYVFVIVFDGGVAGSAVGTLFGQACSCLSVLWFFTMTKNVPLKLHRRVMVLEARTVRMIFTLGIASFCIQAAAAIVNFVLNNMLVKYGAVHPLGQEAALASIGVIARISGFVIFPLVGVSIAIQPLLGYNYGAHLFKRVRTTLLDGMAGATVIGTVLWICMLIWPTQLVGLFGIENPELVSFTAHALLVANAIIPVVSFQIVGSNYFQAIGQPLKSAFLSLSRQVLFLIPLYMTLPEVFPQIFPGFTSLDALYYAIPLSDAAAVLVTIVFLIWEMRRIKKLDSGKLQAKKF